jgi:hypothetical protein
MFLSKLITKKEAVFEEHHDKPDLSELMLQALEHLQQAYDKLNYATDEVMIDSLIYDIKAINTRITHYCTQLKELEENTSINVS